MKAGSIFTSQKENQQAYFERKVEEAPRNFNNDRSVVKVMLTAFWDSHSLLYMEFGPDACKEKQNVKQETYFDTFKVIEGCDMV